MTTYLEFKNFVYTNIARDSSDTLAALVVPKAVNYAIDIAAILFKPPELSTSANLTLTAGTTYITVTQKFIDIITAYNTSDSNKLWFIPYELFNSLKPSTTSIKYFSLFGTRLYVNTSSLADKTITIYYVAHPTELSADDDEIEFTQHDAFIISIATALCFAVLEEGDSADIWARVGDAFGAGAIKSAQLKEVVSGSVTSLEATLTGALAGAK